MYTFDTATTLRLIREHHSSLRASASSNRRWHRT
jgi:hypothetical protein